MKLTSCIKLHLIVLESSDCTHVIHKCGKQVGNQENFLLYPLAMACFRFYGNMGMEI